MSTQSTGIPIGDAVQYGWETFKKNAEFILAVEVAAVVTLAVVNGAAGWLEGISEFHGAVMAFANFVVTMIVHLGAVKIALKYRDRENVEFANMFDSFGLLAAFMAAAVLTDLAVGFGLLFLVVPGIIVAVRFCLAGFLVVDEECGPIEAIQRSIRLTEGVGIDLFLFGMLLMGLNILGMLVFLVGVFVSIPVTILAAAYVYRHINPRAGL
jgi:uncharacterized membrane protein